MFLVIMTSRCFNFRFAYPLPLLPYLHTTRMASGHPTDKFSFMYQPDTHKRYGTRTHTLSHSHASPAPFQRAGKLHQKRSETARQVHLIFSMMQRTRLVELALIV